MVTLTPEQQQALDQSPQGQMHLTDPRTGDRYVLVQAEVFDRLQSVLAPDTDPEAMYPLLADISPEDWEDASVYAIAQEEK